MSRPTSGACTASSAAPTSQTAPIAAAPQPARDEVQRAEHARIAEEQRRQRHQREPGREAGGCAARAASAAAEGCSAGGASRAAAPTTREHDGEPGERAEDRCAADQRRGGADDRAEERAEDGRAHRAAEQLAAALARRGREQPRERSRPGERAAAALEEARGEQRPRSCPRRRSRRSRGPSPVRPTSTARRAPSRAAAKPPGQAADQRAGRVRGDEHAGTRLREPELVREMRQERRQRGVQHRVDEDERRRAAADGASRPRYQRSTAPRLPIMTDGTAFGFSSCSSRSPSAGTSRAAARPAARPRRPSPGGDARPAGVGDELRRGHRLQGWYAENGTYAGATLPPVRRYLVAPTPPRTASRPAPLRRARGRPGRAAAAGPCV